MTDFVLNKGPLSVCFNANDFQSYVGGIMTACSCGDSTACEANHCAQIVGVDTKTKYWKVRMHPPRLHRTLLSACATLVLTVLWGLGVVCVGRCGTAGGRTGGRKATCAWRKASTSATSPSRPPTRRPPSPPRKKPCAREAGGVVVMTEGGVLQLKCIVGYA